MKPNIRRLQAPEYNLSSNGFARDALACMGCDRHDALPWFGWLG
jgi:hypothetical protein